MANNMIPPTQQPPVNALIPPVAPPPSPALGFQAWASDPQNAMKVTHAMVAPDSPLQPNAPGAMASANPPGFKSPAKLASVNPPGFSAPPMVTAAPPKSAMPDLGSPSAPPVQSPAMAKQQDAQRKMDADVAEQTRLHNNGAGLNQTHNGFLRGLERIGDVVAPFILGGGAMAIPGTTLHNLYLQGRQAGVVGQDQAALQGAMQQQQAEADLAKTQAETANIPQMAAFKKLQLSGELGKSGQKMVDDGQGNFSVAPDENSAFYQKQQLANQYLESQKAKNDAVVALDNAKASGMNPNSPNFQLLVQKANSEMQRNSVLAAQLGLSKQRLGFEQDKFYDPQPTGKQRSVGNLAESAVNQVHTMRQIINSHPEIFGPVEGRTTSAQAWLGSQSPDAQRFMSASKYLADHSAGVFGARSAEITRGLEGLTKLDSNPAALNAALDQAEFTANHFVQAGKIHGRPDAPSNSPSPRNNMQPPNSGGKPLSAQLAQQFLSQAGGDKNKARQLAKQSGYSF